MHSLRAKLLTPFIAGTLALTILLAWYTYSSAKRAVEDAMLLISAAKTSQVDGSMTLLYKSVYTALQNMVVDPHVTAVFSLEGDKPHARQTAADWLSIVAQGNDYYRDALIVDANGICVASSNPGHLGRSFADKAYVQLALQGRFNFGESAVGLVTKKLSAIAAGPVDNAQGVAGVLILINDFPKIVDYAEKTAHDSQVVFTALLAPDGLFMAHRDKDVMGNGKRLYQELYTQLAAVGEQGGTVEYLMDGQRYVGYAKVEPTSKWVVVSSGLKDKVLEPAYQVGLTVLGISLAFLCAISFVVIRFTNGILSSLFSLIGYASKVSEGSFELDLRDTDRKDELGILHKSLQRLVQALRAMLEASLEAGRMKGQFLANMSHEIRTPLNAIIGMVHLMRRDGGLPEKQSDYLDKVQLAAKSLFGLINDILDISKVEAGMLELEQRRFNLKEMMENAVSLHQEGAIDRGLTLSLHYADDLPGAFIGDPLRIGQVVNNLISNALKFTKAGSVDLRCMRNEGGAGEDGRIGIRVSVADTGIGMTPAVVATLFQPFTQADASITRQYGGTGLGLAISDRLVHLLGGEFAVESEEGRGTTFSFTMRLTPDMESPGAGREDALPGGAFAGLRLEGKRILVAEDNAINQLIMQELMAPSGADIVMANNGQEAVEAAQTGNFDLIFMDMQMPVMGGLEATRRIRAFADEKTLPIVAITANAMKEDKDKGFASGMNDYLTKPVEPEHLMDILRTWLS